MVIYFSGTGNSKYITDRIAGGLQEKLLSMNERIKSGNTGSVKTGENLIAVVPTYAWRIPRVVSDWIGQTEFVGAKNVWYVMSCGSGIGGADIYNRKLSEKKGLKHMGTAQIIMPENYIAMFNAPDVEKAKKIVAAAGPDIAKAVLAIKHGEKLPSKSGLGASFESGLVNDIFYAAFVKANAFRADQTCTGCGKCKKFCPLNNITLKNKTKSGDPSLLQSNNSKEENTIGTIEKEKDETEKNEDENIEESSFADKESLILYKKNSSYGDG